MEMRLSSPPSLLRLCQAQEPRATSSRVRMSIRLRLPVNEDASGIRFLGPSR